MNQRFLEFFLPPHRHVSVLAWCVVDCKEAENISNGLMEVATITGSHVPIFRAVLDAEFANLNSKTEHVFLKENSMADFLEQEMTRLFGTKYLEAALGEVVVNASSDTSNYQQDPQKLIAAGDMLLSRMTESAGTLPNELRAMAGYILDSAGRIGASDVYPLLFKFFVTRFVGFALTSVAAATTQAQTNIALLAQLLQGLGGGGGDVPTNLKDFCDQRRDKLKFFLFSVAMDDTGESSDGRPWSVFDTPSKPVNAWANLSDLSLVQLRSAIFAHLNTLEHPPEAFGYIAPLDAMSPDAAEPVLIIKNLDSGETFNLGEMNHHVTVGVDPLFIDIVQYLTDDDTVMEAINRQLQYEVLQSLPLHDLEWRMLKLDSEPSLDILSTGCVMLLHEYGRAPIRCHICLDKSLSTVFIRRPHQHKDKTPLKHCEKQGVTETLDEGGEIAELLGKQVGCMTTQSRAVADILGVLLGHKTPAFKIIRCHEDDLFHHMRFSIVWKNDTVDLEAEDRITRNTWVYLLHKITSKK